MLLRRIPLCCMRNMSVCQQGHHQAQQLLKWYSILGMGNLDGDMVDYRLVEPGTWDGSGPWRVSPLIPLALVTSCCI